MLLHKVLAVLCGIASAFAGALGLLFLVLWAVDSAGVRDSLPELIGAVGALATGLLCHLVRWWLRARIAVQPSLCERAI